MATTNVNYKIKVININTHLNIRSGAGTNYPITGKRNNGDTFMADKKTTLSNGTTWYRQKGTDKWSCAKTSSGAKYLKVIEKLSGTTTKQKESSSTKIKTSTVEVTSPTKIDNTASGVSADGIGLPTENDSTVSYQNVIVGASTDTGDIDLSYWMSHYIQNKNNKWPKDITDGSYVITKIGQSVTKEWFDHDFTIGGDNMTKYQKKITSIKRALNAPTAWTSKELYKLTHVDFNRFKMEFPDTDLKGSRAVIFITRPELNLLEAGGTTIRANGTNSRQDVMADLRVYGLLRENIVWGQLLSKKKCCPSEHGLNKHVFNPLLSNQAYSLDVQDDMVDVLETSETVLGYKIQYSKHSTKSTANGSLNIKYKELSDLSITKLHQIWVDYQNNVYLGIYTPVRDNIWRKIIDYMCDIYYFLLAEDGETILFWSKYYGCFPVNVPKSTFSYDRGSEISLPEVNVTYNFIHKEDLSMQSLVEFNQDSGFTGYKNLKYLPVYDTVNGHTTTTWAGVPYVQTLTTDRGLGKTHDLKLRYTKRK